jgi:hypothetical protein
VNKVIDEEKLEIIKKGSNTQKLTNSTTENSKKKKKRNITTEDAKERLLNIIKTLSEFNYEKFWINNEFDKNLEVETSFNDSMNQSNTSINSGTFNFLNKKNEMMNVDENFINLFFKLVFQFNSLKSSCTNLQVFRCLKQILISTLRKMKDFHIVASLFIRTICENENFIPLLIDCIKTMKNQYHEFEYLNKNQKSSNPLIHNLFISELFQQIGKMNAEHFSNDQQAVKNISQFISEASEKIPSTILSQMSFLIYHLNTDVYTIRNSIIYAISRVIGKIIENTNNNGDDAKGKELNTKTRDQLLSILEERLHDTNAYTRSKVIQCWIYLFTEKLVPLKEISSIMKNVMEMKKKIFGRVKIVE